MNDKDRLKLLQLFHIGLMADTLLVLERYSKLKTEERHKEIELLLSAETQLKQFNISNPSELFSFHYDTFGFTEWTLNKTGNSIIVTSSSSINDGKSCKLCNVCKMLRSQQPCSLFCIIPLKALSRSLSPNYNLKVKSTCWESHSCCFQLDLIV